MPTTIETILSNNLEDSPVLIPEWPHDYPESVVVWLDSAGTFGIPESRLAMLSAIQPERIWVRLSSATLSTQE